MVQALHRDPPLKNALSGNWSDWNIVASSLKKIRLALLDMISRELHKFIEASSEELRLALFDMISLSNVDTWTSLMSLSPYFCFLL